MNLPQQSCRYGYTLEDLTKILSEEELEKFNNWMSGQTVSLCDGQEYDYELKHYIPTFCGPHGAIVYKHEIQRFLAGGPPLD